MCTELHFRASREAFGVPQITVNPAACSNFAIWCAGCTSPECLRAWGKIPGCNLTTLLGTIEGKVISETPAAPRSKYGWLPLLTVLFLISYGLMTMLIVEQGQTIESQRALIRELFRDSTELSATKLKAQEERNQAHALAQNPSSQTPSTQTPSAQAPSTRAPMKQAPSSQAGPQQRAQIQVRPKPELHTPSKPAADLADHRRALITI